ncbi:MAG TPA: response regulator transcription factor [Bacteroidales bacterium]|nr:response regulator transcription factor [Bacteroidales bacterium]
MIKVFIVDDHDIFRDGIKLLLSSDKTAEIVGEARNGQEFLDQISSVSTDVVLMDISMPIMDGIEATRKVRQIYPDMKILALSMYGEEKYYYQMIQSGVKGFILKSAGISELLKGINEVASGHCFFSAELVEKVIASLSAPVTHTSENSDGLTKREIEVLARIALGETNEKIAEKLHVSTTTVRTHRANLLNKTGCGNTASLVMYAIKHKYIEI